MSGVVYVVTVTAMCSVFPMRFVLHGVMRLVSGVLAMVSMFTVTSMLAMTSVFAMLSMLAMAFFVMARVHVAMRCVVLGLVVLWLMLLSVMCRMGSLFLMPFFFVSHCSLHLHALAHIPKIKAVCFLQPVLNS